MHRPDAAALVLALACGSAAAQNVSMSGRLGDKALLMIDGTPTMVAAGNSVKGVKVVAVDGDTAMVEVGGKRLKLAVGGTPVNIGGVASAGGSSQIVMTAGSGGHFSTQGSINGKSVRFLVDTGATLVSMSQVEAERLGIDFRKGMKGMASTANGAVPVYKVALNVVRVGDVDVYNVDALVMPAQMEQVLLGNSFLSRFQMKRENDKLTLDKRF